jgi:hypothetical protein
MEWESAELNSFFAPLILTPEQYYDDRCNDSALRPIKRLMLAILEDALRCLHKHADAKNGARRRMYREAEQWLCWESTDALFSFGTVCETLGIDPDYLRSGLRQWREKQSADESEHRVGRRSPVMRNASISSVSASNARRLRENSNNLTHD